ncbi:MAG: hypothetical protein V1721_07565 [Pseudomonadota bacterium]
MTAGRPKGQKKTGGRRKGAANVKTREIADAAIQEGITPLEVMLEAMREAYAAAKKISDPAQKAMMLKIAHETAKDAAPYIHPKLAAVERSGDPDSPSSAGPVTVNFVGVSPAHKEGNYDLSKLTTDDLKALRDIASRNAVFRPD